MLRVILAETEPLPIQNPPPRRPTPLLAAGIAAAASVAAAAGWLLLDPGARAALTGTLRALLP